MPKLASAIALLALLNSVPCGAEIVDFAGYGTSSDGRLMALDDLGNLWRLSNDCPDDWRLVESIPGAVGMDWDGNIGAVVAGANLLIGQVTGIDFEVWQVSSTIPLPAPNIVDVAIHQTQYWLLDDAGQVWIRRTGLPGGWLGPCGGPDQPVPVEAQSFGKTKAAHR